MLLVCGQLIAIIIQSKEIIGIEEKEDLHELKSKYLFIIYFTKSYYYC
jgi:hypothetical protein